MEKMVMEAETARQAFASARDEIFERLEAGLPCTELIDRLIEASDMMSQADRRLRRYACA